jgi:hypothetical protein
MGMASWVMKGSWACATAGSANSNSSGSLSMSLVARAVESWEVKAQRVFSAESAISLLFTFQNNSSGSESLWGVHPIRRKGKSKP